MSERFKDALLIQEGACNPSGIAHALVKACKEVIMEGGDQRKDPAIRLIAHQLSFILDISEVDEKLEVYNTLTEQCKKNAG